MGANGAQVGPIHIIDWEVIPLAYAALGCVDTDRVETETWGRAPQQQTLPLFMERYIDPV